MPEKQKYALISDYTFDSALKTIQKMMKHGSKGDWRQNSVIRVLSKKATMIWTCRGLELLCSIYTVISVGMTGLLTKLQPAAGWSWESEPVPVQDHFQLKKTDFKSREFDANVSYSGKCVVYVLFSVINVGWIQTGIKCWPGFYIQKVILLTQRISIYKLCEPRNSA